MSVFVVFPWCTACALRGTEKSNLTFRRYTIVDAKRQQTGLVKVQTDFCQGKNTILGHDYPPGTAFS